MTDLIKLAFEHADNIISVLIIAILAWDRLRSGSNNLRKEITEDYKERNRQLEDKIKEFQNDLHNTNILVAELKGIVQEKDKHIESLTKVLQGRNPEMVTLLNEIKEINTRLLSFMEASTRATKETLDYQTNLLEGGPKKGK